ncbi:hypothetical protein Fmac_027380 [Flemingia macrophylla]|uniref:DNA helicase n=1 Tax=Flemingia macrophylla TaxID=520843 RepID=A0ABD1LHS3_9FABA
MSVRVGPTQRTVNHCSRFDLIYLLLDKADEQIDRRLAKHIVSLHFEDPEVITATPRQIESLIRLSEALARICFSEKVEKCDVMEEFRLLEDVIQQSATDQATGSFSKHCYEMTFL